MGRQPVKERICRDCRREESEERPFVPKRLLCKICNRARIKAYEDSHKEQTLLRKRMFWKRYYAEHAPELIKAKARYNRQWQKTHPEKRREYNQRYNTKKKLTSNSQRLAPS